MAHLLAALAPKSERTTVERAIDNLTPTQIAEGYMRSKINSIRIAQLRGYEVSDEELELVANLLSASRSEATKQFIKKYTGRDQFLPLANLNATYELGMGGSVTGAQRRTLAFYFFTSDGPDEREIDFSEDTELILIGHSAVTALLRTKIKTQIEAVGGRLSTFLTSELIMWPLDNPYVPQCHVYKRGSLQNVAEERGIKSVDDLARIDTNDIVARLFGMEVDDILIETRLAVDMAAMARRMTEMRICKRVPKTK